MPIKKQRYFMCDFETTVFDGQEHTEVWAAACVELYTEDVKIFHSIDEQLDYFLNVEGNNIVAYYHNLKFDGTFWLDYLMIYMEFKLGAEFDENGEVINFKKDADLKNKEIKYLISNMGHWYTITFKYRGKLITLRDSLKLLPFSVEKIGKSFGTKHKKLSMNYSGFRYAGCEITKEEQEYIANDVLVVKEALEIMFDEGHKKLTIGSCCLSEYQRLITIQRYRRYFPDIYKIQLPEEYGSTNAGDYIRKSYRGGWCYLVKGKENIIKTNGCTADVNSLYPSMMSSESLNKYPIGEPTFWKGNYIPNEAIKPNSYYFVRIKTRFYLREGYLPTIQIKNSFRYRGNEMLETSDVYNAKTNAYYAYVKNSEGVVEPTSVILTLTMTDFALIQEHYELVDFEILDGCYFESAIGIFDEYIEKYKLLKMNSTGAKREEAKLFLNNLYGKMAASEDSSYKIAYIKDDKTIGFYTKFAKDKKAGYIPVGSAITSYARNFTIRAAQKNYYGADKRGFIYADTDSIHCDLPRENIQGVKFDDKAFCCWKLESEWQEGLFVRQKTYVEKVNKIDGKPVEPHYDIRCAGMPDRCKNLFLRSMRGEGAEEDESKEIKEFLKTKRSLEDFKVGLCVPAKLIPKKIRGGTLLVETTYEMR